MHGFYGAAGRKNGCGGAASPRPSSQPQALDVLDLGQDDVAVAPDHPRQGVDDLPHQPLHLLAGGGHRVDVETAPPGNPVNLGDDGIFPATCVKVSGWVSISK